MLTPRSSTFGVTWSRVIGHLCGAHSSTWLPWLMVALKICNYCYNPIFQNEWSLEVPFPYHLICFQLIFRYLHFHVFEYFYFLNNWRFVYSFYDILRDSH